MKLLKLLKEVENEFDFRDQENKIYQRKLGIQKIRDYIANGSKGSLDLTSKPVTSLGNLKSVGGNLFLYDTPITSLGNLESVGGNLVLIKTPTTSLGNLESVGGYLNLTDTPITSLGNLESVGGNLYLRGSKLLDHYTPRQIRAQVKIKGKIYK
jgi:hypothetical protein